MNGRRTTECGALALQPSLAFRPRPPLVQGRTHLRRSCQMAQSITIRRLLWESDTLRAEQNANTRRESGRAGSCHRVFDSIFSRLVQLQDTTHPGQEDDPRHASPRPPWRCEIPTSGRPKPAPRVRCCPCTRPLKGSQPGYSRYEHCASAPRAGQAHDPRRRASLRHGRS